MPLNHDTMNGVKHTIFCWWPAGFRFFGWLPAFLLWHTAVAQDTSMVPHTAPGIPDSLHPPRRQFWPAAGMLMAAEITPWVVDRYIRQMDYARLTWKSTAYNLSLSHWEWDGDGFTTNQFGHPYHGSLFFSAYRSNGYSFWQAAPAVFAGSYLWETFAENQAPAPNDLINTGFGGIVLGELAHRFANRIVSERRSGFRRQAAEISALLINPVNGLRRITNKQWGKPALRDTTPVETELDAGWRRFRSDKTQYQWGLFGRVRFSYGNPFRSSRTPFDHFSITAELGQDDSSIVNVMNIAGTLRSWRINPVVKRTHHALLLTANYDFIRNTAFFYSAQSVRVALLSAFNTGGKVDVQTQAGGGLVVLAAVPDPVPYKGRYYDYAMGLSYTASVLLKLGNRLQAGMHYRGGYLRTVNGSARDYFLQGFSGELRLGIVPGFYLCAEPGHFTLKGRYTSRLPVTHTYPYVRYSFRWTFTIR